ncbi:uncharacterized protein KGF55_003216 [Candida pseudojiufengensis]|uniref:uncharacterized protein n=1 Tax=Candida pseudojiufengensis TaxID=497109 RepID=UPI00222492BC|nr:uncharacterized protein KGF55_003216 [Candida pseudojiufengensis]KAI5962140.1 hypothetical protein KGF55_003216 [Candida pseudojiufengensis]
MSSSFGLTFEHENLLSSLSLDDKPNGGFRSQDDVDAMDIDDPMDIDDETEIEEESINEVEKEEENETKQQDHNLLALISPTMLGAKLAVHKPKLLMPPSPTPKIVKSRKPSIDYEFDTSSYRPLRNISPSVEQNSFITKRNNTTYQTSPDLQMFLSSTNNKNEPSTTIHHHHYYGSSPKDTYLEELKLQRHQQKLEIEKYLEIQDHQKRLELYRNKNFLSLPSPWKTNIHPIEKIPYLISSYLQLFLNFIISLYLIYLIYYIAITIKSDINHKINLQKQNLQYQIEICTKEYYENQCNVPEFYNLPILKKKCLMFEKCMKQNPNSLGNLSLINAQIFGMLLNSLIEPLGFKFFLFILWCGIVIFGCNFLFGYIRAKTYYGGQIELD